MDQGCSVDLERFMVDGNMSSGQRFKFVPLSDSQVQDPSSSENGLVVARFWLEKVPAWVPPVRPTVVTRGMSKSYHPNSGSGSMFFSNQGGNAGLSEASLCCSAMDMSATPGTGQAGATVAGSYSSQGFVHGYFGEKDFSTETVVRLRLCGQVDQPVTVEQTRNVHCGFCGKKARFQDRHCSKCGNRLDQMAVTL